MSTIIRGSGDTTFGGTIQSTGIDDNATSTAITIDASEKVGIGTPSPSAKLHVSGGADSTIRNTATSGSSWFVGSNIYSYILHNESNTPMVFTTDGTEKMRITSDGRGLSQFTAKAWVNFNGTSTVAIRDSHNVSSITDNGTGQYGVNFTGNMTNTNYSVASATSSADWGAMSWVSDLVVGSFKIYHHASNAGSPFYQDGDIMCAQVFGD